MRGNIDGTAFDSGRPIVALDIDGTLGDYHGHFLRFAEAWYGRAMPDPAEINPGIALHKFMGTSKATYRECKLAYRQGGLKRSMPAYQGASELTAYIRRELKAEVWICTTRPYLRLDNIDPDTRHWLRRNRIGFDGVVWGPNKYRDLARRAGRDRIVSVLDDELRMLAQARSVGISGLYVKDQPYNKWTDSLGRWDKRAIMRDGVLRINDFGPMLNMSLAQDVREWYNANPV